MKGEVYEFLCPSCGITWLVEDEARQMPVGPGGQMVEGELVAYVCQRCGTEIRDKRLVAPLSEPSDAKKRRMKMYCPQFEQEVDIDTCPYRDGDYCEVREDLCPVWRQLMKEVKHA